MGVPVQDCDPPPKRGVGEEVAVSGLVSAAEDDGHGPAVQVRGQYPTECRLIPLQVAGRRHVAEVNGVAEELAERVKFVRVGGELAERLADRRRAGGGAGPAAVAA